MSTPFPRVPGWGLFESAELTSTRFPPPPGPRWPLVRPAAPRRGSNRGWMDLDMLPIGRVGGLQNMSSPAHEQPCSAAAMACNHCLGHGGTADACDDNRHPECCGRDTRLTFEEQRLMMTLWAVSKSTLFVGGDPTTMSDAQVRAASRSPSPQWGRFDFVWLPARTPHGAYVW